MIEDEGADLPTVIGEGVVKLGALEITVLQLSNGERVIDEQSMRALMGALFGDETAHPTPGVNHD